MRSFSRSTPRLFWLCLLLHLSLCMALFCGSSRAQNAEPQAASGPLTMEIASPLALTQKPLSIQARQGRWIPLAVTFSNTGEPIKGTLKLTLTTATVADRSPTQFFTEVDLPTNARKRVWLYGRVARDDIDKFEINFQGRGFKSLAAEGAIQVAAPETRLVLTISDSDEKLSYLSGLKGPGLNRSTPDTSTPAYPQSAPNFSSNSNLSVNAAAIRPLGAPHELIPSRWIGLDSVDLMVLQDFPHSALTPLQVATVKNYAAAGGAILVLGGANWQRLATSPLADLWPVTLQSSGTAPANDASTLVNRFARFPDMTGADRLGGAPVVVARGVLRPGVRALLGNASAPLFAIRDFGAGQILFLSVDPTQPPFLGWRGHARMWADIFRPTQRPLQIAAVGESSLSEDDVRYSGEPEIASATDALLEALKNSRQLKTPPVAAIAWFLALYVFFLVPVNYIVLRFFDRRELAWLTIPVIVLIFSVMSYAAALRIKGTAILTRQVNLVQTSDGSKTARADAMLWLFSPRKTTYDISSRDPQMVVGDYLSDQNVAVSIRQPEENQAFALDAAPINMWDWRSFVGHSTVDLKGGVRVVVQGSAQNGKIGIQNNSAFDLKSAVLVCDNQVLGFPIIKAGATSLQTEATKIVSDSSPIASRILRASKLESALPKNQVGGFETIPEKLLATAVGGDASTLETFLAAWSDQAFSSLTIGREDAKAQNLTLLLVRVENDAPIRAAFRKNFNQSGARSTPPPIRVKKLSVETLPQAQNKAAGSITTYEAQLPASATRFEISAQLNVVNNYGNSAAVKTSTLEIFDFKNGLWRAAKVRDLEAEKIAARLKARPKTKPARNTVQSRWDLRATLAGELARAAIQRPDGLIQLRVRTYHDDMQINKVAVVAR